MRLSAGRRRWRSPIWSALVLTAFLAVGPGLSGVEVAFHLFWSSGPDHLQQVHFEEAGTPSHSDHCQLLTLSPVAGRLPVLGVVRLPVGVALIISAPPTDPSALVIRSQTASLPRAPPFPS